ncbi:MAG: RDD family protein [Dehalococcoidia bacterium]
MQDQQAAIAGSLGDRVGARVLECLAAAIAILPLSLVAAVLMSWTGIGLSDDANVIEAQGASFVGGSALIFAAWAVYETVATARGIGTFGKRANGLRVAGPEGRVPGWRAALLRQSALTVPIVVGIALIAAFPGGQSIGALLIYEFMSLILGTSGGKGQSFHDMVAGTRVIKVSRAPASAPADAP